MHTEYIRPHSTTSDSSILSISTDGPPAYLTILHAGYSSWPNQDEGYTSATERGHAHNMYHILLYTDGHNTMIHNGQHTSFCRGTLILTDPGTVHAYRPQSPGGGGFIEITFDVRTKDQIIRHPWFKLFNLWFGTLLSENMTPVTVSPPYLEHLERCMHATLNVLTGTHSQHDAVGALSLAHLLLEVALFLTDENKIYKNFRSDTMAQAQSVLERRFSESITVAELAEIACLSPGAFIRSFKKRYGLSPIAYRKQLRMNAAKHLLAFSGRSIGEIASNVGYSDIFVFSRTFRAETGMTTTQWRRMNRHIP